MVAENPDEQSTTGKLASGYMKVTGYTNIFGAIVVFIIGGGMVLLGISLALWSGKFGALIFSAIGLGLILIGCLGLKFSKRAREGKYYQVGKGWTEPK